jgi:hypothetical protein
MDVRAEDDLARAIPLLREVPGPTFVTLKVTSEIGPLFPRNRDGVWQKNQFRTALLGHP